jgi:hypothetical protein
MSYPCLAPCTSSFFRAQIANANANLRRKRTDHDKKHHCRPRKPTNSSHHRNPSPSSYLSLSRPPGNNSTPLSLIIAPTPSPWVTLSTTPPSCWTMGPARSERASRARTTPSAIFLLLLAGRSTCACWQARSRATCSSVNAPRSSGACCGFGIRWSTAS